jgi:bifunctional DNA-binding transcriptional regulator/antitoxin component of YhaV-PrlF toxin-antitoxin module
VPTRDGSSRDRGQKPQTGLKRFGVASLAPNGQISIPVDLRRAWGIEETGVSMEVYGESVERKIVLVEVIDDATIDEAVLQARLAANARRTKAPPAGSS